jgi:phosphatidylinositol alpha-1,6-mannosyltransferase
MRLVIAAHNFPPARGGIQRLALGLAEHILPGATTVVTDQRSHAGSIDRTSAYEVVDRPLSRRLPPRWVPARRALADYAGANDALLALEWWPEGRALASLRSSRRSVTAVVVHGTDVARCLNEPRARRSAMQTLHAADVVVAVSNFTADLAAELGVAATVINPGVEIEPAAVDSDALAARLGISGRPVVLTVARLVPRKGHADLLAEWYRVVTAVPEAIWLVVGDGPEAARLQRDAPPSVRLLGDVDDETLTGLYRLADVHAMPGRTIGGEIEGFGMAAIEAGAQGTPTVATAVGGTAEAVGAGGVVVPDGRADLVAEAIVDLLLDQERRDEFGQAARRRAEQLAWPLIGRRYRDLLGAQ